VIVIIIIIVVVVVVVIVVVIYADIPLLACLLTERHQGGDIRMAFIIMR